MVELGYKALEVKIVANTNTNDNDNTNDNRAGHYGEDNNIYLIDDNINNAELGSFNIGVAYLIIAESSPLLLSILA
jgi:hypothetical protein